MAGEAKSKDGETIRENKERVIRLYTEEGLGEDAIAGDLDVNSGLLHYYLEQWDVLGDGGGDQDQYINLPRDDVLAQVVQPDTSKTDVAEAYGVSPATLSRRIDEWTTVAGNEEIDLPMDAIAAVTGEDGECSQREVAEAVMVSSRTINRRLQDYRDDGA